MNDTRHTPAAGLSRKGRIAAVLAALGLAALLAGCVSIYDKVDVNRPESVDQYSRTQLDKCDPHIYPFRLIGTELNPGTTIISGGGLATNQATFDLYWAAVTPVLDVNQPQSVSTKPSIDWTRETAYFVPVFMTNSCEKVKTLGMFTDCYSVWIAFYKYVEGTNCNPRSSYPMMIFIYPTTTLPVGIIYPKTPDYTPTPTK